MDGSGVIRRTHALKRSFFRASNEPSHITSSQYDPAAGKLQFQQKDTKNWPHYGKWWCRPGPNHHEQADDSQPVVIGRIWYNIIAGNQMQGFKRHRGRYISETGLWQSAMLLYALLTGSTPVDRKSLAKAALLEILRIVREVEAPKPRATA